MPATCTPDFIHDTFSSFYPLGVASPVLSSFGLDRYGLEWSHAPAVVGTPTDRGEWALLHHDPAATAACLDRLSPGDGDGWLDLVRAWDAMGPQLVQALLTPFPPVRGGARLAAALPRAGGVAAVRLLLQSARSMVDQRLKSEAAKMLLVGNAAHADIPPDSAGSGLFGWLLAMLGQRLGYPVPRGGAGQLSAALAARFEAMGGRIITGQRVDSILLDGRRATGVRVGGERFAARHAVVVDVPAPVLYGGLIPFDALPRRTARGIRNFEWDPSTVKVDWAMSGPVPWQSTPDKAPGTVHLADSVTDVALNLTKVTGGIVPAEPFMLIGQMTSSDPTRSPAGTESLWAYTHVPQHIRTDEAGELTGDWSSSDGERFADRMQARIERYAPGFSSRVLARRVLTPLDLEERNPSLIGGAVGGGTSALHQQLVFRPIPGRGRAETPFRGLYLGSSSAHPGGGVHGACGANAARAALWHARFRR